MVSLINKIQNCFQNVKNILKIAIVLLAFVTVLIDGEMVVFGINLE